MRVVASLLLVALWVAIAFAALLISTDPDTGPVAERGAEDAVRESAEASAAADQAEGDGEEEAEEVFTQAELESPEFEADREAAAEPARKSVLSEIATALRSPAESDEDQGSVEAVLQGDAPALTLDTLLSDNDSARYKQIFRHQSAGRWRAADKLIKQLENKVLLGHVRAQRYLHPSYRSSYRELTSWLARYGDHPGADKLYRLALKKRQPGGLVPRQPQAKKKSLVKLGPITRPPYVSTKRLTREQRRRVRNLRARMYRQVSRLQLSATERLLATKEVQRLFDDVQIAEATAWVAAGWYYYGRHARAFDLAQKATGEGEAVPLSHWISGLAAWRLDDLPTAALHFEALALSPKNSGWNDAAGPFWAARAHEKLGHQDKVEGWLRRAAAHPRTLYGLMARHRLGLPHVFDFSPLRLDARRTTALSALPGGARALAFLKLGDHRRVEKELNVLEGWREPAVAEAIMAVAEEASLPALSLRISLRLASGKEGSWDKTPLDAALYPIPPWKPRNGFKLDRALIFGVIRQESQFKRYARSRDGARGLMQLLPSTARGLARGYRFQGAERAKLYNPELNMELGQRYLSQLMKYPYIDRDIFRVATAYNGGPGNLRSWNRRINHTDPLVFIESIPVRETREFVKHVVTNLWVYRLRLDQEAPTLADVAYGHVPRYAKRDGVAPKTQVSASAEDQKERSFWSLFGFD